MRRTTAILVTALVACALGQDYILKSCVIDEGGSQTASSGYVAKLSFGQPIASNAITSSGYSAILGFWRPGLLPPIDQGRDDPATAVKDLEVHFRLSR